MLKYWLPLLLVGLLYGKDTAGQPTPTPIGEWGEWSEWTGCSVTCGGGEQTRTRTCPQANCRPGGEKTQTMAQAPCNDFPCEGEVWPGVSIACSPVKISTCLQVEVSAHTDVTTAVIKACKTLVTKTEQVKACVKQAADKCNNDPNASEIQKMPFKTIMNNVDFCIEAGRCGKLEEITQRMTACYNITSQTATSDQCRAAQHSIDCSAKAASDCPAAWSALRPMAVQAKETFAKTCPNIVVPPDNYNAGAQLVVNLLTTLVTLLIALLV